MAESLTESELLEELDNYFNLLPERPEGWIDCNQAAEKMGCDNGTARKRMEGLVKNGTWEKMIVKSSVGGKLAVYRLKQKSPPSPEKEKES